EQMNGDEAGLLLRLKGRLGDRRSAVTGQVFDGLLHLEGERAVEFVGQFLESASVEVRDDAALALGSSRLDGAGRFLIKTWNETLDRDFGAVILRSLSSSRQQPALEFLLDLVRNGSPRDEAAALDALELHRDSPDIRRLIEEAKTNRKG